MPQSPAAGALVDPLAEAYRQAWLRVQQAQISMQNDPAKWRARHKGAQLLQSISADMAALDEEAASWVSQQLPKVYAMGGTVGTAEATGGTAEFIWEQVAQEAVQRIATGLYQDLLSATKNVSSSARALVRKVGQDAALKTALDGKTAQQAGREMARILQNNGIHAITYANGAKRGLGEYAEMATRTVTANTYNTGALNAGAKHGTVYWEVFDGPFCGWASHDDRQAHGMIVTRDEAAGHPTSHPNCRRAFGARPDIKTPAEAKAAQPFSTPAQRQAQIAADKAKAERLMKPGPGKTPNIKKPNLDTDSLPPMADLAPVLDPSVKVPTIEQLINDGWAPEKAIEEHAKQLKLARAVETRAGGEIDDAIKALILQDSELAYNASPTVLYTAAQHSNVPMNRIGPGTLGVWFQRLKIDTQEYVPVSKLEIHGHVVQTGMATRRNGISYLYETRAGETFTDTMRAEFEAQIKMAETVMAQVPDSVRGRQKGFAFLKANNPADAHWAKAYDMPDFKSSATGGDGGTYFWNSTPNPGTIAHEFGHNLDKNWAGDGVAITQRTQNQLAGAKDWVTRQTLDADTAQWFKPTVKSEVFIPTRAANSHQIVFNNPKNGVTTYGGSSIDEDFAESVRLYLKDRREGKLGYLKPEPGQSTGQNIRFSDIFPERAKMLDSIFGLTSEYSTPWRVSQIEKVTARMKSDLQDPYTQKMVKTGHDFTALDRHNAKTFGLRLEDVQEARATAVIEWQAAIDAAKAQAAADVAAMKLAMKAAASASTHDLPLITYDDIPFKDKTGLGVKAAFAKKKAKAAGKSDVEAQVIFDETKKVLTAQYLELANADRVAKMTPLTVADLSHVDKTSIGVRAAFAKKAAKKEGKSLAEAQTIFDETKDRLTAELLAKLNAERGIVGTARTEVETATAMRPGARPAGAKTTTAWLTQAGKTKHPLAGSYTYNPAAQAKANLVAELTDRMNTRADWELFRQYRRDAAIPALQDVPEFDALTATQRHQLMETEINARIQQWAGTSGNSSRDAVAMQMAIKDEFGVTGPPMVRVRAGGYGAGEAEIIEHYKHAQEFYRAFVRRMYEHTQEEFRKAGITEVHVYRGMNLPGETAWARAGQQRPELQPANSWSSRHGVSKRFGRTIFSATIPVSRVLGSARTGFGCLNEYEFVIFDSDGLAQVGSGGGLLT